MESPDGRVLCESFVFGGGVEMCGWMWCMEVCMEVNQDRDEVEAP